MSNTHSLHIVREKEVGIQKKIDKKALYFSIDPNSRKEKIVNASFKSREAAAGRLHQYVFLFFEELLSFNCFLIFYYIPLHGFCFIYRKEERVTTMNNVSEDASHRQVSANQF